MAGMDHGDAEDSSDHAEATDAESTGHDDHDATAEDGASVDPAEPEEHGEHGEHEDVPSTEPADRPRAWVFGGFAVINGSVMAYAAWLRRRTAPDRDRRKAARAAALAGPRPATPTRVGVHGTPASATRVGAAVGTPSVPTTPTGQDRTDR